MQRVLFDMHGVIAIKCVEFEQPLHCIPFNTFS